MIPGEMRGGASLETSKTRSLTRYAQRLFDHRVPASVLFFEAWGSALFADATRERKEKIVAVSLALKRSPIYRVQTDLGRTICCITFP